MFSHKISMLDNQQSKQFWFDLADWFNKDCKRGFMVFYDGVYRYGFCGVNF